MWKVDETLAYENEKKIWYIATILAKQELNILSQIYFIDKM